jgi:lipoprotein NlpD
MKQKKFNFFILFSLFLAACASQPPSKAPVYENSAPVVEKSSKAKTSKPSTKANSKDWRPDIYTVKKGDTLYSIGLEFGYDYKEIAQNNNISAPYNIRVGQQLNLKAKEKTTSPVKSVSAENDDVFIKPLNNDGADIQAQSTPSTTAINPPTLNSPKATREAYSDQAYNAANSADSKTAEVKSAELKSTESKPLATGGEEAIDWTWPTKGKVTNGFSEGANVKGIDIEGKLGQDINAAGPGKVIYSGSDLRGYGNLVIVKHNKDYLSVYAHNSKILVKEGQSILKGQKIAEMGNSGTDIVKLHFEIRYQGKSVDPTKFLSAL